MNEKSKSNTGSNSNEVIMSVRYLDGSLLRQEFKRSQKLSDVRKWIDDVNFFFIFNIYYIFICVFSKYKV